MKLLVTGSSGYLGSNFINHYKSKYNVERFSLLNQKIEGISFDSVDVILHCAALVHQKDEQPYEKYHAINIEYPVTLAKLAKQNGVKQFVFISTIAVYGENLEKVDENTQCNPVSAYGKSKLEAEKQLLELGDQNFTVSIIRPPMVYGKDAPGNIDSLIRLVKKVPILPLGAISNKRSFVFIENLCYLIDTVLQQNKSGTFLCADDEPISTSKLIEFIAHNLEKKIYLVKVPFFETLLQTLKPSFYKRLYGSLEVDNTITKHILNLKNPYSVKEGIKLMIKGEKL